MSGYQNIPLSRLQKRNAQNLQRTQREAAYATLHSEAEVDRLAVLRAQRDGEAIPPACPYLLRAVALALQAAPRLNAHLTGEGLCIYDDVDLGLMVVRRDGVIVPTVRAAAHKTPDTLAEEAIALVRRAKEGTLRFQTLRKPTFTVVDLSGCAVDAFTPILPVGTVGILGAGRTRLRSRPTEEDPHRTARVQSLSLTFDHRAANGIYTARFLSEVVHYLEHPDAMLERKEAET